MEICAKLVIALFEGKSEPSASNLSKMQDEHCCICRPAGEADSIQAGGSTAAHAQGAAKYVLSGTLASWNASWQTSGGQRAHAATC